MIDIDGLSSGEISRLKSLGRIVTMFSQASIPEPAIAMFIAIATREGRSIRYYAKFADVGYITPAARSQI